VATQLQVQHAEIAGKADITTANNPGEAEKQEKNERNDKKFPELQAPHLVLSSPVGIESSTAQSTHQHSGQHHAVTTGGHTSLSAGKSVLASAKEAIKLFAYRSGMRLVSAVADIDIQALQQSIQILAKLNIQQEANRITLTAREEIVINGGGSYSRFNAAGIEEGTRGTWLTRAIHHRLAGPQSAPLHAPAETHAFNEMLELRDTQGRPTPNYAYRLQLANGRTVQGVTDHKGQTLRAGSGESATWVRMNPMKGDQA
jgi:type VI secretion system secreted protein VgrG